MSLPTSIAVSTSKTSPAVALTGYSKLRWAVKNPPGDPAVTFAGKTVLVTGANAGLGFQAAIKYAQKGCAKLILAVRSQEKGEEAKKVILESSGRGNEKDFIRILTVDLTQFASVHTFCTNLENEVRHDGLHIALLNAGLASPSYALGPHGYEVALQVNVLSTALMAHHVLPLLQRTANDLPHMTFVESIAHAEVQTSWFAGPPSNGRLVAFANDAALFDQRKHYGAVKLLGMAVMQHFARETAGAVVVNSCCPFMCRTDLGRNFGLVWRTVFGGAQMFLARSAEEGARTLVGATALGKESQGLFWHHDVLYPMGDVAKDEKEMKKFWGEVRGVLEKEGQL